MGKGKILGKVISREEFVRRANTRRPVGLKLTRLGKIFKIKKYG